MSRIHPDLLIALAVLMGALVVHSQLLMFIGAIGMAFATIRLVIHYLGVPNA